MKKLVAGLVVVVALLVAVIAVMTARGGSLVGSDKREGGSVVNEQVIKSFKISALTYQYTNMIYSEEVKKIGKVDIPFTKTYLAVRYEGVMEIGIDGNMIKIDQREDGVTITLPPAKVLSHTLVPGSTEVMLDIDTPFNENKISDYTALFDAEQLAMEQRAAEAGLLTQAEANAKEQLTAFLNSIPGVPDDYTITVKLSP